MPKVLSSVSFKNAIIDKYKSIMGIDTKLDRGDAELLSVEERFEELSEVPSRIDSDFRFVGDETDPVEVVRRAPDFESVIVLLDELREERLKEQLSTVAISEAKLERAKERSQRLEDLREGLPEYDYEKLMEAERQQLLKDMGPPWLLLYLFSRSTGRDRSYNYLEETSLEDEGSVAGFSNDSFDMRGAERLDVEEGDEEYHSVERRRSSTYSMPASVRSRMSSIYSSATRIANEVLSRIICMVDEAIIDGECTLSVASIASFIERKSHDESARISEHDFSTLKDFMEEAQRKELEVKDLNQLYHFFVGESFKAAADEPKRDRSKEITSIFEASGIEVDNTLLDAQISENMILGLVHKESEPVPTPDLSPRQIPADEAVLHVTAPDLEAVPEDEEEPPEEHSEEQVSSPPEVATQTDPLNVKCTELMRRRTLTRSSELMVEYSCRIPPIPGIGPPLSEDVIQAFLGYLAKRAIHQQGLIYLRNFRETPCPKIG
ncbi:hypothetical protein quinque_004118 [Culex quinquefasciatus]